jgi:hypothetical protein
VVAHYQINLLGFLGLTIVGVAYQFYPPAVGSFPGANDRTALVSLGCLAVGVALEASGLLAGWTVATTGGQLVSLTGAFLYTYLLFSLFSERYGKR